MSNNYRIVAYYVDKESVRGIAVYNCPASHYKDVYMALVTGNLSAALALLVEQLKKQQSQLVDNSFCNCRLSEH